MEMFTHILHKTKSYMKLFCYIFYNIVDLGHHTWSCHEKLIGNFFLNPIVFAFLMSIHAILFLES